MTLGGPSEVRSYLDPNVIINSMDSLKNNLAVRYMDIIGPGMSTVSYLSTNS